MTKIGASGFEDSTPINQFEIRACKKWIKTWVAPIKTINHSAGSYALKGKVEKELKTYISNGAFIVAATSLGYNHKRHGELNAFFNMSLKKLRKNGV